MGHSVRFSPRRTPMTSDPKIAFLQAHGADSQGHSDKTLLSHLQATAMILADWSRPQHVCDAGLFHSVYGTESFTSVTIPQTLRPKVQALISAPAERRAWLFGVLSQRQFVADLRRTEDHRIQHRQTKEWVAISKAEQSDLLEMIAANALEQLPRMPEEIQLRSLGFFAMLREQVSDPAATAIDAAVEQIRATVVEK
jgi:(p)ppGpp synthase/HD superfamily hydrolase